MKERQFKVGDRIKLNPSSKYYHQAKDEIGTIVSMDYLTEDDGIGYHSSWIRIEFDNDYKNSYLPQDLYLADDITFRVGDKIQITQGTSIWNEEMDQYVGKIATITSKEEGFGGICYRIDIDKRKWHWFPQHGHFIHAPQAGIDQKDELLHRAKQMFPVGTKFSPAHVKYDEKYPKYLIMTEDSKIEFSGSYIFACIKRGSVCDLSGDLKYGNCTLNRVLYDATEEKWATIIDDVEEDRTKPELLAEACRRYPIGTKYKNATDEHEVFTVTDQSFSVIHDDVIYGESGAGCLMYGGKWAEIVKDIQHKFSVGDWVIANSKANIRYAVTTEGWSGQVTSIREKDGYITVKGKYNEDNDEYHDLDPDRFDLTTESELMRLIGNVETPTVLHKYKVGDILHLTKFCHAVDPQKVTVSALTSFGKTPFYRLNGWAGDFPEELLSIKLEVVKPTNRFKVGDWVIGTCPPHSPYAITCKGWIGKVVGLNPDGTMDLNADSSISIYRNVRPEYFEHHNLESVFSTDYLQQQMDKVSASISLSHEKLRVYSSGSIGSSIPVVQPQVRVKKVSFNRI